MADPLASNVADLLPQTGTARLLNEVVDSGPGFVHAVGRIPAGHPLATNGFAPCFLGLELAAQAAAVLEALLRAAAGEDCPARVGYLVRVREAEFLQSDLPVEAPLNVTASLEGAAPPVAIYRVVVAGNGAECLRAVLVTHGGTDSGWSPRPSENS